MANYLQNSVDFLEDEQFVSPPSQTLICPICQELFKNPIITKECSHSFCSTCIVQMTTDFCPLCRHKLDLSQTHYNLALDQIVKEQQVYCQNRPQGCKSILTWGNRTEHQSFCEYSKVKCPHQQHGCPYKGMRREMSQHLIICPFEQFKDFIYETKTQMSLLTQQVEAQTEEIKLLKHKLDSIQTGAIIPTNDNNNTSNNNNNNNNNPNNNRQLSVSDLKNEKSKTPWDRYNLESLDVHSNLVGHKRGVTSLAYCEKTNTLYSGSHDTTIRVWHLDPDIDDFQCVKKLEGHKFTVWALCVTKDGQYLFSGSSDGTIIQWKTDTYSTKILKAHTGKVYCLEITTNMFFSAGQDRNIIVWDLVTCDQITVLRGNTDTIWSLYIYSNCLYSGSDDGKIMIWDLNSFDLKSTIEQQSKILSLAVGKNRICIGTNDCLIKIWDKESRELIDTLFEHKWEVWQVWVVDGLLFTGSFDHTIKVWDLETLVCLKTLSAHKGYIHALTGNSSHLFSGSGDKTIKVWDFFPKSSDSK